MFITYRETDKYKFRLIEAEEEAIDIDPVTGDSAEVMVEVEVKANNKLEVVEEDKEDGDREDAVVVMVEIVLRFRMKDKLEDRAEDEGAEDNMEVVQGYSDRLDMA